MITTASGDGNHRCGLNADRLYEFAGYAAISDDMAVVQMVFGKLFRKQKFYDVSS